MVGLFRMLRLNRDPAQQALAGLFAGTQSGEITEEDIEAFFRVQGWSDQEVYERIPHALSITKLISDPRTYSTACLIGLNLSNVRKDRLLSASGRWDFKKIFSVLATLVILYIAYRAVMAVIRIGVNAEVVAALFAIALVVGTVWSLVWFFRKAKHMEDIM